MGNSFFKRMVLMTIAVFLLQISFAAILTVGGSSGFKTIKEAVWVAKDGDEISVNPGTYTENLRFQKAIKIKGTTRDKTILRAADPKMPAVLVENSKMVVIEGLTIETEGIGISLAMSSGFILTNIIRSGKDAIRVGTFGHEITINDNILAGNLSKRKPSATGLVSNGIFLVGTGKTTISYNEIKDFDFGIYMAGKKPCKINNNAIYSNFKGVFVGGNSDVVFSNNKIQNNLSDGFLFGSKAVVLLENNVLSSTQGWELRLAFSGCDTGLQQEFSGKISGINNIISSMSRICPVDYSWSEDFFSPMTP